jgi:hypothetical protein
VSVARHAKLARRPLSLSFRDSPVFARSKVFQSMSLRVQTRCQTGEAGNYSARILPASRVASVSVWVGSACLDERAEPRSVKAEQYSKTYIFAKPVTTVARPWNSPGEPCLPTFWQAWLPRAKRRSTRRVSRRVTASARQRRPCAVAGCETIPQRP